MAEEHLRHHVALRTSEDEIRIMAMLDVCAQDGFHIAFSIGTYCLKLIDGDNARFVGCLQIMEDFFEGCGRACNVTQIYSPRRIAIHVKTDGRAKGVKAVEEVFHYLCALRFQAL